ncbi:SSI family serine proteinase inhibitor [Streptomyces neyagawaensis]|uniref:SSI family serine proteinase inhibitor n=1 Tax=Streptomyces neyagawaensis TaxID=42238 RepID=UPI00201D2844|nr:SSI family serine proteinase inhibitor [Streptomyces neyagawaensis]MCL6738584.1 subtilase-type protease inhibitor [Streptomyces neyagawaensis]MDE1681867.1 SSI family serine proteinase inhibitor [Streptomyces neyagawaensis]
MLQSPPPAPPQASPFAAATSRVADSRRSDLPVALRSGSPRTAAPGRPARRALLGVAASLAAAAAGAFSPGVAPAAYAADGLPRTGDLLPRTSLPLPLAEPQDRLVVTVRGAGGDLDGRFELHCHPDGGSHPHVGDACGRLDQRTTWGKDPFAPVEKGAVCTMMYGGPATAHVTGTWAGRPVDARYDRGNGCEIARWDALVPVLPDLRK